jgi:hypothetical protein
VPHKKPNFPGNNSARKGQVIALADILCRAS